MPISQIALWLRQVTAMQFCDNTDARLISAQLFRDAADAAQAAASPGSAHPDDDGLHPGSKDFT
jgi:hypothetical protein